MVDTLSERARKYSGSAAHIQHELEELIDFFSIGRVVAELATVCRMKAEHLATNWQDTNTAAVWNRIADAIDTVSDLDCEAVW